MRHLYLSSRNHRFGCRGRGALVAALLAGCSPGGDRSNTAQGQQAIASEQPNDVAQLAPRLYTSADVTRAGYAVPDVGGCTGEMIGPNMLMTAAHCGDNDKTATFYTYRNQSPSEQSTESFYCHILLDTFPHTDIALAFCDPNAAGENPGDKYGYLDFDHSQPAVGENLFSYWYNPIVTLGVGWGEIYSIGKVTTTDTVIWGPPGNDGPMNEPVGIGTDLWTQPGASGSPILNASNFRILVGPTSTGVSDAAGRWAQSSKTDFEQASISGFDDGSPPTHHTGIHDTSITALGLPSNAYTGKLDKDGDYLFDIQRDAEQLRGENARDWYYLGFESERRNALWHTDGSVTFDTSAGTAHVAAQTWALGRRVMVHDGLPLEAATTYRVSVIISTSAASSGASLHLALLHAGVEDAGADVPTAVGTGFQLVTFELATQGAHPEVAFVVNGTLEADLVAFSVIKDGAVMSFDTADKRFSWRNDNTGGRGLILPDGNTTATTPNWAGYAVPTPGRAANTDWPLRNRELALVAGRWYTMCADVKSADELPITDSARRVLRVLSAGTEVVRVSFRPSLTWSRVCTGSFRPTTSDNNLQVGFDGPAAQVGFFVDNVSIDSLAACVPNPDACSIAVCGAAPDGCGGSVSCGVCDAGFACQAGDCVCARRTCSTGFSWDFDLCACVKGLPH